MIVIIVVGVVIIIVVVVVVLVAKARTDRKNADRAKAAAESRKSSEPKIVVTPVGDVLVTPRDAQLKPGRSLALIGFHGDAFVFFACFSLLLFICVSLRSETDLDAQLRKAQLGGVTTADTTDTGSVALGFAPKREVSVGLTEL